MSDYWQQQREDDAVFADRIRRGLCGICADVLRETNDGGPRECPRHGAMS